MNSTQTRKTVWSQSHFVYFCHFARETVGVHLYELTLADAQADARCEECGERGARRKGRENGHQGPSEDRCCHDELGAMPKRQPAAEHLPGGAKLKTRVTLCKTGRRVALCKTETRRFVRRDPALEFVSAKPGMKRSIRFDAAQYETFDSFRRSTV